MAPTFLDEKVLYVGRLYSVLGFEWSRRAPQKKATNDWIFEFVCHVGLQDGSSPDHPSSFESLSHQGYHFVST